MRNQVIKAISPALVLGMAFACKPAAAQEENATDTEEQIAKLKAEIELLQERTTLLTQQSALAEAEAKLAKDRIAALSLPEFKNQTTFSGANAGQVESALLSSRAIVEASGLIATAFKGKAKAANPANHGVKALPIVLLYDGETVPWHRALMVRSQIAYHAARIKRFTRVSQQFSELALSSPAPTAISAAISAAAKLLGQETTVQALPLTAHSSLLMRGVAGKFSRMGVEVRRPEALLFVGEDSALLKEFVDLQVTVQVAKQMMEQVKGTDRAKEEPVKTWLADLTAEIASFESFEVEVTKQQANGTTVLGEAARYTAILDGNALIGTVHADFAGGSAVTTKNLWTYLGADPMRISGGLLVSYTLTEPATGRILTSGIIACRTAFVSLRQVQDDNWARPGQALCNQP